MMIQILSFWVSLWEMRYWMKRPSRTEAYGQRPEFIDARCLPFIGLLGMGSGTDRYDPLGAHDQPCHDRTGKL